MICYFFLLLCVIVINPSHFNGGTIRWVPVNSNATSGPITITITQTYSWVYPTVSCLTNVPLSSGRTADNVNLTCVADCSSDGGYSSVTPSVLTDCISASSAIGMMTSQRSVDVTLLAGAHFYVAFVRTAWISLGSPAKIGLGWSIVSFIDLRQRSDGFINTPPMATVISPQYVIVNQTTQIPIFVSDDNPGDDLRCRWAKNASLSLADECSGVCYPASMPSGVSLSNCTLTFKGPIANVWYAVAIQVEDFIGTTSTTPMSSVPLQFLIYVIPQPVCSQAPVFIPLNDCLEVTVGVTKNFSIFVLNLCNSSAIGIADILVTYSSSGMQMGNLLNSSTNMSLYYKILTWTPQASHIGPQELCLTAYTTEFVQSTEYCITFTITTSSGTCLTTTSTTVRVGTTSNATTNSTTATVITEATTTAATNSPGKGTSWGLIAGILSVALPLALCSCCCLYRLLWSPAAKRRQERQQQVEEQEDQWEQNYFTSSTENMLGTKAKTKTTITTITVADNTNSHIEVPKKSYHVYNIVSNAKETNMNKTFASAEDQGSILVSIYNSTNGKRSNNQQTNNTPQSFEMKNVWTQPSIGNSFTNHISDTQRAALLDSSTGDMKNSQTINQNFNIKRVLSEPANMKNFSTSIFDNS